jgi:hypothetical protein
LEAENISVLALDDLGECTGAFPMFLKRNFRYGNIINSLPFYGSNGGIVSDQGDIMLALMEYLADFANRNGCVAYTIISSPFDSPEKQSFYNSLLSESIISDRVGILTRLIDYDDDLENRLLYSYHQKTRNIVRKAKKNNITVTAKTDEEAFNFLGRTHNANTNAIGILPKPQTLFAFVKDNFLPGTDYNLYLAYYNGIPISGLLVFYFNTVVEYYCPVNVPEFRNLQALSLIIHEAMKEAVRNGFKWWNWGGVSRYQKSIYDFKKKWGIVEIPYFYYTKILNQDILDIDKDTILNEFKYFFVFPFEHVGSVSAS